MICKWGGRGTKNRKWRINSIWIGHFTEWNSGKCEHCRFTYPANILIIIIIIIIIIIMIYCLVFRINSIRNYLPFDENVQNYRKSGPILSQFNENNIKVTIFPETYFVLFSLLLISLHKPPIVFCVVFVIVPLLVLCCYCAPPCAVYLAVLTTRINAHLLIPTHAHFHWLKFIKNI